MDAIRVGNIPNPQPLKAADVALARFFGPPTETNFAGAWVTGSLDAVEAAARAFEGAVADAAARPTGP